MRFLSTAVLALLLYSVSAPASNQAAGLNTSEARAATFPPTMPV